MQLIYTLVAVFFGFLSVILMTVFISALHGGQKEITRLRRKQYGLRPWITGGLANSASGATMHELEGIEMKAEAGKLVHVRQTRAPSSELI